MSGVKLMNLNKLKLNIDECTKCNVNLLKSSFFGNKDSIVLFVAQNAGTYKPKINLDNVPFNMHDWTDKASDRASGDLLKIMFRLNGIYDYAITNLVKCPISMSVKHIQNCFYWLQEEIKLMQNLKMICCLGKYSGHIFNHVEFGKEKNFYPGLSTMMIHHPGYFLRNPKHIELYKYEFVKLKESLDGKI